MFFYNYNDSLKEYEKELNEISSESSNYKQFIQSSVKKFFNKIKKKHLAFYFKNINKENILINQTQRKAFSYLMKLAVQKYKRPRNFISQIFPDYVESRITTSESSWLIIRLFHIFISWFTKPKLNIKNFLDAKKLLISVRRVQEGLYRADDEEFNEALEIIVVKFLHDKKIAADAYIPINKSYLFEKWNFYNTAPSHQLHCLDIDNLLNCLASRISSLESSKEKKYLFSVFPALKDFVYKNNLVLFKDKYQELIDFLKKNTCQKNMEITQSIKIILLKIMQRLNILNKKSLMNGNIYLTNNLIKEKIEQIKFYYEAYRANWEKAYVIKATTTNYYDILNSLENALYDVCFILDTNGMANNFNLREIIEILGKKTYISDVYDNKLGRQIILENLFSILEKIQTIALQLKNFSEQAILKNLSEDMISLSEFIYQEIAFLQPQQIEEYNQINFADTAESNEWGEEWDEASDTSEDAPDAKQFDQEDALNKDGVFITNTDIQSDRGISEQEIEVQNFSKQSSMFTNGSGLPFFENVQNQPENLNMLRSSFRHSSHG